MRLRTSEIVQLRSEWRFAAVSHYLNLFRKYLKLEELSTESLEVWLTSSKYHEHLGLIVIRILQACGYNIVPSRDKLSNWVGILKKVWKEKYIQQNIINKSKEGRMVAPYNEELPILKINSMREGPLSSLGDHNEYLSAVEKAHILHCVCEWMLNNTKRLRKIISDDNIPISQLRLSPISRDSKGYVYWLFSDMRIYRELQPRNSLPKNRRLYGPSWEPVCLNISDWSKLLKSFGVSRHSADRNAYHALTKIFSDAAKYYKTSGKIRRMNSLRLIAKRNTKKRQVKSIFRVEPQKLVYSSRGRLINRKFCKFTTKTKTRSSLINKIKRKSKINSNKHIKAGIAFKETPVRISAYNTRLTIKNS